MAGVGVQEELSGEHILCDGSVLSVLFATFVYGSLAFEPEMWVNDYPPDIREQWGEKSERAKKLSKIVAIPFLTIFFGGILLSNWRLRRVNNGRLSFGAAFLNAYALYMFINLFDMTIMDWLIFTWLSPDFVVLPGTEGMAGY